MAPKTTTFSYKKFFGSGQSRYLSVESKKLTELKKIDVVVGKLFKVHERHYKKILDDQRKSQTASELETGRAEETSVERGNKFKKFAKSAIKGALKLPGIRTLIETLLKLAALGWIAKNPQSALGIVKFFKGVFDVFSAVAGFAINNILDGLYQIIDGPILSKIFGVLKLVVGLFALRYVLKPWKIITDLKNIWKNKKTIQNVWKGFVDGAKNGLKPAIEGVLKSLPATANLFKHGLKRGLTRAILSVFGKGGFKILSGAAKAASGILKGAGSLAKNLGTKIVGKTAAKTVGKIFSKIPIIGPLIGLAINLALGDPLDKAIFKAVASSAGQALGAWVGGTIGTVAGSVVPIIGNILAGGAGIAIGSVLGGLIGDFIADKAYDFFKKGSDSAQKTEGDEPKLAAGGIVTKETKAIIGEAGPEAVIPLKELGANGIVGSKIIEPFKVIGSAILGTMFKVITSFGPLGVAIVPLLKTILAPSIQMFGLKALATPGIQGNKESVNVKTAKIKKGKDNKKDKALIGEEKVTVLPIEKDSSGKKPDYKARLNKSKSMRSLLADILNNIIQLDFASPAGATASGVGGGGGGGDIGPVGPIAGGPMHQKGANIAKKLVGLLGIKDFQAAGIVGNIIQESSLVADRIQGSGMKRGPLKLDGVTGYSYPQWTSIDRQQKFANYMERKGFDWRNKGATDELATGFLATEFKEYMSSVFTGTKDVASASNWVLKNYEKPSDQGPGEQQERAADAAAVLEKMQTGGVVGAAKTAVEQGKKGPASPPCASWVRMVLAMAGNPAAQKTTKKGDLDPEGTKYNGPNYAASFAGSDLGAVIRSQSALQPGDVVLHQNTYGSFPSGSVTHVSIASTNKGKIYHQPTSGGAPKEGGIFNFKAGIRLGGSGSVGTFDSSSSTSGTNEESSVDIWKDFEKNLRDLTNALSPSTPSATPAMPVGPKFEGLTVDQISQAYAQNTKPIIPLNNIILKGGNTQITNVNTQDFSAFAPPDFNSAMNSKLNFTTKL